ncbi:hypothetical protein HRbin36_01590 [bacterium HR36]|nr:hypothetical protein HRbin36_01590 [bacterium HR36]
MKKMLAALLVAILSVAVLGCGGGDTKPTGGGGGGNTGPTATPGKP